MNWRARYGEDPELSDFDAVEGDRERILVRRGYESVLPAVVGGVTGSEPVAWTGGGRAAHPVVRLPDGERVVVREYRRGGAVRHLNRSTYFLGYRAMEELRATVIAERRGVRVPRVIAAVERPTRFGYTATLVVAYLEETVDLARWLDGAESGAALVGLRRVGREIARMHDAFIAHPDLNLRNVLVGPVEPDGAPEPTIIDFDRAVVDEAPISARRRARDLRRFARSARKLGAPVDAAGWAAFRDGYGDGWPLPAPLG